MSTMMVDRAPFRVLLGHALVRDQWARTMHKSAGNSIQFEEAADDGYTITDPKGIDQSHPPMGSDVIRWIYCRHAVVNNVNFGPGSAEEVRSKFIMKLWNSYAFFCNYAQLDRFDPTALQVPVQRRPDIDRWILSDLQKLVMKAHEALDEYDVQSFCLEAEDFIDNRLSNWYVRRNRRRFWKSEQGPDKTAAYQTLYTVLMTLTKLLAPIVPFLTESIYQNLKAGKDSAESVHLCDYPQPDKSLVDEDLTADMHALLRLVSLASAVRNLKKIKVRQPLAELRIQPGDERDHRAMERFADQICEEQNLKRVTLHEASPGPLLHFALKPNIKTLGPKFGNRLKEVVAVLAAADTRRIVESVQAGQGFELSLAGETISLAADDVIVEAQAQDGWIGLVDRMTQLALDTRITEALELEGLAREVIRHVQNTRKDADLALEDRIILHLKTDSAKLQKAIDAHRDYIAQETLTTRWASDTPPDSVFQSMAKVEGSTLLIELCRDEQAV
jgi:isoleucyl-tRNA synthetase